MDRPYDIVLFGATGFTGTLTASYLALHAPEGCRWALAGRNQARLEAVRSGLTGCESLPLMWADVADAASMRTLAESAHVVISTVGPYARYGEPVVAACAAAGTDYVDLTGESRFVDEMYLRYQGAATSSGARLVHSCGYDSIPYDLGALFTVGQLPEGVPISLSGYAMAGASISGGTLHSAVGAFADVRKAGRVAKERRAAESAAAPLAPGRRVAGVAGKAHNESLVGGRWVVPAPTIDPQHVLRSARALERYGPDFTYSHYMVTGSLARTAALIGAVGSAVMFAQVKPTRQLLLKLKAPGDGPSPERRAKSFFKVRFVADTPSERVITEVSGGDPGYTETSKMLAESALCLAFDSLPEHAGQLTTAVAMGQTLTDRLIAAGIQFSVVTEDN